MGGGLAGFAVAVLLNAARSGDRTRRVSAYILLALIPVLCVGLLVAATDAKGLPRWQKLRQKVLARAVRLQLRVREVGVNWRNDPDSRIRPVRDSIRMLASLLTIRRQLRRESRQTGDPGNTS